MSIFTKWFGKKQKTNAPSEYSKAIACNRELEELLSADEFIARSDYKDIIEGYKGIYTFFQNMKRASTLS